MTPPVDTSVKYWHSGMQGVPVLYSQTGSLLALIRAFLITGCDLKPAASIIVASGLATLTFSGGHSAEVDSVIAISGVTGALVALNGEQKIKAKTATTLAFATAAADGAAAGTITFKMAPLGWTEVFTGSEVAVFKSSDIMANGHYLRIDDTQAGETRVTGYESMTDVNTGVGPFPTPAQVAAQGGTNPEKGGYWSKGINVSATNPIGWTFFGDTRLFMYGPMTYQSQQSPSDPTRANYVMTHLRGFGDPIATRPSGDVYGTTLACSCATNHASSVSGGSFSMGDDNYGALYTARHYNGLGTSTPHACRTFALSNTVDICSGMAASYLGRFPSPIDGGLRLSERYMRKQAITSENDYAPRATIPGILYVPQSGVFAALPPRKVIPGSGKWLGRNLVAVGVGPYSADTGNTPDSGGITFMDITGPWR